MEKPTATDTSHDPFCSERNIKHLLEIIDGIENGTRPLAEHDLIDAESIPAWDPADELQKAESERQAGEVFSMDQIDWN